MFYLNETLDANAAHSSGLVTKIIDEEDFDKEVMSYCTKIAAFSSQVSFTNVQMFRFSCILTCT